MFIYLIIGTIICLFTSYRMARRDINKFKSDIRNPLWWIVTVTCVVFWPVLLACAIYDLVKLLKTGEIEL